MPFDKNSTTEDVLASIDLSGKTVLITGGSTGLGAETARALASKGASVTIVARSAEKLAKTAESIKADTGQDVETASLELDKPETIRAFAKSWLASHDKLDILINNAGIMATPLARTKEGWESQFATNHLGHFLLTNLLAAPLKAAGAARVINLSSGGHWFSPVDLEDPNFERRDYDPLGSYGQSKTANIWLSIEVGRRWAEDGVTSFAVHPGGIATELGRNLDPSVAPMLEQMMATPGLLKSIPQGAATSCWAATSPELNGKTGLYLEDCHISEPGTDPMTGGRAPHAYAAESAVRLWDLSNGLLGTGFWPRLHQWQLAVLGSDGLHSQIGGA
ncbi:SDR family NAD(P)-dependent oxidoreductase [Shimia sp. R9_3]|uniref:SDR family NAD(P)-dependent oxidoreductase n=1 Tax=Shimia sp. R9_3 TaxID=2821113 RepID=UPI001AD96049|nr:SDR family NAD(P)-dependent oxidoreductase [Shimia sp. R9_3]MBO9399948.1 SDR family NAD(P)-dependent oxidoreductase [Shimia sp. R9_3]